MLLLLNSFVDDEVTPAPVPIGGTGIALRRRKRVDDDDEVALIKHMQMARSNWKTKEDE